MVCSAFSNFRRRPASTALTASSRITGRGSAISAPSDLKVNLARAFCKASSPASKPSKSSSKALSEACLASERVRTVARALMNPLSVKASIVPELDETMVPAGNRMSLTFRFDSVSPNIAASSVSNEGAHKATGTPRDRTNETDLLEAPD